MYVPLLPGLKMISIRETKIHTFSTTNHNSSMLYVQLYVCQIIKLNNNHNITIIIIIIIIIITLHL